MHFLWTMNAVYFDSDLVMSLVQSLRYTVVYILTKAVRPVMALLSA